MCIQNILTNLIILSANKQETEREQTESVSLPRTEVIKRLRERGHPILLFGESELQSFKRLRRIEIQEPEANRVIDELTLFNSFYIFSFLFFIIS